MNRRNFFGIAAAAPFVPLVALSATKPSLNVIDLGADKFYGPYKYSWTRNIDCRGASADLAARLREILEAHAEQVTRKIAEGYYRGKLPL